MLSIIKKTALLLVGLVLVLLVAGIYDKVLLSDIPPKRNTEDIRIGFINLNKSKISKTELKRLKGYDCDLWMFIEWNGDNLDNLPEFSKEYFSNFELVDTFTYGLHVLSKDSTTKVKEIDEEKRPQIIFRRCPVDKSDRFNEVIEKYKDLICSIDPDWKTEKEDKDSFTSIYPTINDNILLVNTIKYSDLIINLGSTMAHDAAVLNKPSLYLNYNPVKNSTFNVEDVFNFEHFKSLKDIKAVGWLNNKNEINRKIFKALEKPNEIGEDRKEWLKRIVLHPLDNNSKVLNKTILDLDLRKKTGCTVIGFRNPDKDYIINPEATVKLVEDAHLIVLGRPEQIIKLRELF